MTRLQTVIPVQLPCKAVLNCVRDQFGIRQSFADHAGEQGIDAVQGRRMAMPVTELEGKLIDILLGSVSCSSDDTPRQSPAHTLSMPLVLAMSLTNSLAE